MLKIFFKECFVDDSTKFKLFVRRSACAPVRKILDPTWGGALTLHAVFGTSKGRAPAFYGGSGKEVKMEIWAWLLVACVITSLVLAARNI